MTLHEFIAQRLAEEPDAERLLVDAFPGLYRRGHRYRDAPWTYASRGHLVSFAMRWADHEDYRSELHGSLRPPLP